MRPGVTPPSRQRAPKVVKEEAPDDPLEDAIHPRRVERPALPAAEEDAPRTIDVHRAHLLEKRDRQASPSPLATAVVGGELVEDAIRRRALFSSFGENRYKEVLLVS